jgi:FkbM family methyltransferase
LTPRFSEKYARGVTDKLKGLLNRYFLKQPRLRRFVTRLLEGDRDLNVRILGEVVRINTVKEHGYLRVSRFMTSNSFAGDELPVLSGIIYFLNRADAFVDAGSNVGVYCAVLGKFRRVHPMPMYAFEPNPDTYRRLVQTVAPLGAETFNFALSDREGTLEFVSGAVSHIFGSADELSEYALGSARVKIPCRRLDSVAIRGERIFLKVDVEGHEWQVLQGASGLFDKGRIFGCYVDGFTNPGIPAFLSDKGFRLYDGRSLETWPKGGGYSLLAVRPE